MSSHPASASSEAANRLLEIPGAQCAVLALTGSLFRSSNRLSVVTRDPFGCVMHLGAVCSFVRSAGAPVWSSDMLAPVSSRAVVFRFCGLVQPGVVCDEFTK